MLLRGVRRFPNIVRALRLACHSWDNSFSVQPGFEFFLFFLMNIHRSMRPATDDSRHGEVTGTAAAQGVKVRQAIAAGWRRFAPG